MTRNNLLATPSRPFVAYIADNINAVGDLASDTARTQWEGLFEEAQTQNCDLLAVVGGGYRKKFGSLVYDLATPETADAFIGWIIDAEQSVDEYFTRFADCNLVSISRRVGPHPVVAEDNLAIMKALTQHLVLQHGRRHIGFIRGPAHHPYAQVRAQACSDAQTELDITFDERRFTPPAAWDWQTGIDGVRYLLDQQQLVIGRDLDAIMCASDRIAMGALEELKRRNIRVPDDVAITGFNNLLEAQSTIPSLTTVAVHFQRKSRLAMRMALATLRGETFTMAPDYLDPVITIGESCGCKNSRTNDLRFQPDGDGGTAPFTAQEIQLFSEELHILFRSFRTSSSLYEQPVTRLIQAFFTTMENTQTDVFMETFLEQINAGHYAFMDQVRWQDVLTVFRKMLRMHPRSTSETLRIEAMLDRARLALVDLFARGQTAFRLLELRDASTLRQLGANLGFSSDVPTIMDILAYEIPRLGITSFWLSVFDGEGDVETMHAPEYAHLLLAMENSVRTPLPEEGVRFPARQLLPEGILLTHPRRTFIMFPLSHGDEEYGFVIFEQGPSDGTVYETLAFSIGSALKSAFLRQELEKRTQALELSIYELGRTRNKLVESEKLAALGELVAGIAHEINTPIGIGVTAISTLSESVVRLNQALEDRSARAVREEAETITEGADIALRNLRRANELVESFKQIAVDQTFEDCRKFELGHYIADTVRSLEPRLRQGQYSVQIECKQPVELISYPGAIAQIMTNLILNSLIHGFETSRQGRINIVCRRIDGHAEIEYRDNGLGMEPATVEKIFHPFFTTKRGRGGTGLGMHIVYNLVTQKLGGSIECASSPGQGVFFQIRIPL